MANDGNAIETLLMTAQINADFVNHPVPSTTELLTSLFTCRNCGGGDRGRVAIYRPFGEVSLSLNRTVTCMVLKANDRRTSCPCPDEFRGPRSDYVRQRHVHGQFGILGQIINVPVSINTMVNRLPRNGDDDYCVNVHIKRRKIHRTEIVI
ncbi:uncharacterized protein TNCV_5050031 [Trichonephila clavipes]|nr:uncharacterized protein TNCV_5050031 [Trichonephila clavipes]